jgi:hypothetical protein
MKRNLKLGVERRKRLDTFDPLVDKQQKKVENVENIKFSYVSKLNFMFSTCSPIFCCLSAIAPDVRKVKKRYIVISVKS